jgi:hypothetical protein
VTVYAKTGTLTVSISASVSAAVGTRMLLHWSDIAIEQERLAWAARRALESEVEEAKASGKGLELGRELHPSLLAVAAASHALDALYGELRDSALPPDIAAKWKNDPRSGPPRPRKLQEALKHGFRISAQHWRPELDELFELRDGAVHPELVFQESEPHPLGVNPAFEYVNYRCEKSTEAVDLLFEILETCASRPKPALESWASDLRPSLERLKAARSKNERLNPRGPGDEPNV